MARDLLVYVCADPADNSTGDYIFQRVQDIQFITVWTPERSGASPRPIEELRLAKAQECDIFLMVVRDRLTSEMETELEEAHARDKDILVFIEERHALSAAAVHLKARRPGHTRGFRFASELGEMCRDDIKELVTANFRREKGDSAYPLLDSPVKPFLDSIIPPFFVGRLTELQELRNWVDSSASGYYFLYGNAGMGKTGLLATFGQQVNAVRVTANNYTGQPALMMAALVQQLAIRLKRSARVERMGMPELTQLLYELLLLAGQVKQKLVVIVDGLDQVYDENNRQSFASFLPDQAPDNVLFVVSSNNPRLDGRAGWKKVELKPLGRHDVQQYLERLNVPETLRKNLTRIVQGSPLFLDLVRRDSPGNGVNLAKVRSIDEYLESIWRREYTESQIQLLKLLAINRGAVSTDLAYAFMNCDAFTLERHLTDFRRFLTEGDDGFQLFHNRMRDSLSHFLNKRGLRAAHLMLVKVLQEDSSLPQWEIPYHLFCAEEYDLLMETVNEEFLKQQSNSAGHIDGVRSIVYYCFKTACKLSRVNDAVRFAFLHATLVSRTVGHLPNVILFRMAKRGKMNEAMHLVHLRVDLASRCEGYLEIARALTEERELKVSVINQALKLTPKLQVETRTRILSSAAKELFRVDEKLAMPVVEELLNQQGADTWQVLSDVLPSDLSTLNVLPLMEDPQSRCVRMAVLVLSFPVSFDQFLDAYRLIEATETRAVPLLVYLLTQSRRLQAADVQWLKSQLSKLARPGEKDSWWSSAVLAVMGNMTRRKDELLDFHEVEWVWNSVQGANAVIRLEILALLIEVARSIRPKHADWLLDEVGDLLTQLSLETMEDALARIRVGVAIREPDPSLSAILIDKGLEAIEQIGQKNASLSRHYLLPVARALMKADVATALAVAEKCQYPWQIGELYSELLKEFYRSQATPTLSEETARCLLDATVWTQSFADEPGLLRSFIHFIGTQPKRSLARLVPFAVEAALWGQLNRTSLVALGELARIFYRTDPAGGRDLLGFVVAACNMILSTEDRADCLIRVATSLQGEPELEQLADMLLAQGLELFDDGSLDVKTNLIIAQSALLNFADEEVKRAMPSIVEALYAEARGLDDRRSRTLVAAELGVKCNAAGLREPSVQAATEEALAAITAHGDTYASQRQIARLALAARSQDFSMAMRIIGIIPNLNNRIHYCTQLLLADLEDQTVAERVPRIIALLQQSAHDEFTYQLIVTLALKELDMPVLRADEVRSIVAQVLSTIEQWTHVGYKSVVLCRLAQLIYRVDSDTGRDLLIRAQNCTDVVNNVSNRVNCLEELAEVHQSLGARPTAKKMLAEAAKFSASITLLEERVHRTTEVGHQLLDLGEKEWAKDILAKGFREAGNITSTSTRVKLQSRILTELARVDAALVERLVEQAFPDDGTSRTVHQSLVESGPLSQAPSHLLKLRNTDSEEKVFMAYLERLDREADVELDLTILERAMELGFAPTAKAVAMMVKKRLDLSGYQELTRVIGDTVRLGLTLTEKGRPEIPGLNDRPLQAAVPAASAAEAITLTDARYCLSVVDFADAAGNDKWENLQVLVNSHDGRPIPVATNRHRLLLDGWEEPPLPSLVLAADWGVYLPSATWSGPDSGVRLPELAVPHLTKHMVQRFLDGCLFNGRRLNTVQF